MATSMNSYTCFEVHGLAVIIDRSNCHVCIIFSATDKLIILPSNLFYGVAYYSLVILL